MLLTEVKGHLFTFANLSGIYSFYGAVNQSFLGDEITKEALLRAFDACDIVRKYRGVAGRFVGNHEEATAHKLVLEAVQQEYSKVYGAFQDAKDAALQS